MDRLQAHRPWSPEPNRKGCLAFPFIVKAVSQSINESVSPCSEALSPSNFLIPGSPFCFCHLTGHLFLSHWTISGSIWYLKAKPRVQCNTLSVSELWTSIQRIYRVHMNGEMPLLADRGLTKTLQCNGKKPGPNQVRGHYFHYLPQVSVTMVKCHDQRQLWEGSVNFCSQLHSPPWKEVETRTQGRNPETGPKAQKNAVS